MLFAACGFSSPLAAKTERLPVSFQKTTLSLDLVDKKMAPTVDTAPLLAEDRVNEASGVPIAMRFAVPLSVSFDSRSMGTWEVLADGSRLWRLRIGSPGALSLNLALDHLVLPEGTAFWLYSADGRLVQGAYEGGDVVDSGDFWTPIILGDEAVLEMHAPAGSTEDPELRVSSVQHGYRLFGQPLEKQGSCNIDVTCSEGNNYRDQIRAVGMYSIDGFRACTGTMVNNTAEDFRPYFLSADHCGVTTGNDNSVVVYWNYESPTCGALSGGSLNQNQTGATLRANYSPSDFALLELNSSPAANFDVYWAGWDKRNIAASQSLTIHHPNTDEKAISFEDQPVTSADVGFGQTHWQVGDWDAGTTEPGSSGSCLFNRASKRCVGTLTGGLAACGNDLEDYYGKFSRHWSGGGTNGERLSNWLDPNGSGAQVIDGAEPGGGGPSTCTPGPYNMCLRDGRFELEVEWGDFVGGTGPGTVVPFGSDDSGLFWFFREDNWEMLVKVIDGCGVTDHYWVFAAATTNVEYTLTVTDTSTGTEREYFNPLGSPAVSITDTLALATCP
ncbi:MAG: hypothetical protein K8J08_06725 [Thermoanaerobaculia bacterium]|nr:hypothetical protein [Thermoanaerobaculia bacterium]